MEIKNNLKHEKKEGILAFTLNGKPATTTRELAKKFNYSHSYILKKIKHLNCSQEFKQLNFEESYYTDRNGQLRPEYNITDDGFYVLSFASKIYYEYSSELEEFINESKIKRSIIRIERQLHDLIDSHQKMMNRFFEVIDTIKIQELI